MSIWWEIFLAVVGFVFVVLPLWLGVSAVIASRGGWRELASHYAAPEGAGGTMVPFSTISLHVGMVPARYRNCITVQLWEEGFGLSVLFPFRFTHPPLLIPWSAIRDCRDADLVWGGVEVVLDQPDVRIRFYGRAGAAIRDEWMRLRAAASDAA